MEAIRVCTLCAAISVFFSLQLCAEEFRSIFDGESLKGWKAPNMSYWSVKDGAITAESTKQNPCTSNQFLVWQGGDVADFELKLKFRVSGNGCNSGVQFRSKIKPNGLAVGYQADIFKSGPYLGGVCDELHSRKGPELLTANGKKTVIDASGKRTATSLKGKATMKPFPEWNDYHIKAKGQHIILEINGVKCSELIDKEEVHYDLKGILGLQLRSGEPMKVQFKDIYLKQFSTDEGFKRLFNGKTLDGWHLENGAIFVVEDGVIKHRGGLGWLRSDEQYSDFVLPLGSLRSVADSQGNSLRTNQDGTDDG